MIRWSPLLTALVVANAQAGDGFVARSLDVVDRKAVIATVEPIHQLVARARIGGTIAALTVKEGDTVAAGAALAEVADQKLALQMQALDSRIASLQSQRDQARVDFDRIAELQKRGVSTPDPTRPGQDQSGRRRAQSGGVAGRSRRHRAAGDRGRRAGPRRRPDLSVPVSVGRVVLPGETIATMAEDQYILRLQLPERHARVLRAGDKVSIGARGLADEGAVGLREGVVRIVYPEIQGGRVIADVEVPGLDDYFVGERTRVYIDTGKRNAIVIPTSFVYRRAGVSYVRLAGGDEVVVQPGEIHENGGVASVEILSGLRDGDALAAP